MKLLLTSVFMISMIVQVYCQSTNDNQLKYQANGFQFEDTSFKWHNANELFNQHHLEDDYQKYLRARKTGHILGGLTLLEAGISTIYLKRGIDSDSESLTEDTVIAIIGFFIVVPVTGTIALISASTGQKRRKKLVDKFNGQLMSSSHYENNRINLNLNFSNQGIGIAMSF